MYRFAGVILISFAAFITGVDIMVMILTEGEYRFSDLVFSTGYTGV